MFILIIDRYLSGAPQFGQRLLQAGVSVRYSMGEPHLIVCVCFELVHEAESIVEIDSFTSPIIIQQKCVVIVQIAFHVLWRLCFVFIPWNLVLAVGNVLASSEPPSLVLFMPLF